MRGGKALPIGMIATPPSLSDLSPSSHIFFVVSLNLISPSAWVAYLGEEGGFVVVVR